VIKHANIISKNFEKTMKNANVVVKSHVVFRVHAVLEVKEDVEDILDPLEHPAEPDQRDPLDL
jgi:hypothetical protein